MKQGREGSQQKDMMIHGGVLLCKTFKARNATDTSVIFLPRRSKSTRALFE